MGYITLKETYSPFSDAIKDEIQTAAAANGRKVWYHRLDVTDADAIPPVFDAIRSQVQFPIRGLVACTGISGVCDAASYPIGAFRKIIDVNIAGTFLTAQAVGRELHREKIPGSIVLIASMSGWISNKVCCRAINRFGGIEIDMYTGYQWCGIQCFQIGGASVGTFACCRMGASSEHFRILSSGAAEERSTSSNQGQHDQSRTHPDSVDC